MFQCIGEVRYSYVLVLGCVVLIMRRKVYVLDS